MVEIKNDDCVGCGVCVSVCPKGVLEIVSEKAKVVKPKECDKCKTCAENCPVQAIKV